MIRLTTLFLFSLILSLTGCSSSSPLAVNYYLLDQDLSAYQAAADKNNKATKVVLTRIKLANYLEQSQLAILQNDHQLYYASQHVWSEDLKHALSRALTNDVNQNADYQLVLISEPGAKQSDYQLELQIDHLVATENSEVILAGKFWLIKKGELITSQPFYFSKSLNQDGFSHAVSQQRRLIKQLAKTVSEIKFN